MKHYIVLEGGGSKLIGILFNEKLECIASGYGGSVNPNFASEAVIQKSVEDCIAGLLKESSIKEVAGVYITFVGNEKVALDEIRKYAEIQQVCSLSEPEVGLLAGGKYKDGIVVLSGTGSDVFYMKEGKLIEVIGGWGATICEEGSGYFIGRMALHAVIHEIERRGPATLMTPMINEFLGAATLKQGIYDIYKTENAVRYIASLTRIVSQAAAKGDLAAKHILETNAGYMIEQTIPILETYPESQKVAIVVAGGVWKNYHFYQCYADGIKSKYPHLEINLPLFEPVIGGIVAACYDFYGGVTEEILKQIAQSYEEFKYRLPLWE